MSSISMKNKTPTVLRLEEDVPPVKAGCRGVGGVWSSQTTTQKQLGSVGLGGRHLTVHRKIFHAGSPPFSTPPSRVQKPLSQEPTAECRPEAWSALVLPNCQNRSVRGLCLPDQCCYSTPKPGVGPACAAQAAEPNTKETRTATNRLPCGKKSTLLYSDDANHYATLSHYCCI